MKKTVKSIQMLIFVIFGCVLLFHFISLFFILRQSPSSSNNSSSAARTEAGKQTDAVSFENIHAGDYEQWEALQRQQLSKYDYFLDSYHVALRVNDDNSLEITETINACFNAAKHGIYRKIPLKNTIERLDGTTATNRASIDNIRVNANYTLSTESGYRVIKIGDAHITLTGLHKYIIQYTYHLGKDTEKGYDELYYNLIGNQWDTPIRKISFTIEMPKEFDASLLGFSYGKKGATDSSDVYYRINGNTIEGYYDGILSPNSGLTVRLELPEGYFANARNTYDIGWIVIIVLPIVFLIISYILWWIFGKDEKVVETVEFYPPEDFNSAELGVIYKGRADDEDVVSLLIYLANQGYLKIEEIQEKSLFSTHTSFKIIQLKKQYTGNNTNERRFFEGLFRSGVTNPQTGLVEVTKSELTNKFYSVKNEILKDLNSKENRKQLFESNTAGKRIAVLLMIIMTYVVITAVPVWNHEHEFALVFVALVFPGIAITILLALSRSLKSAPVILFFLTWELLFGGMPWMITVLPSLLGDTAYLYPYLSGLLCIVGMSICFIFMPKRTPYGNKLLGRVKGFKNFLETAEKDRLEALVMENPSYFYDILPYTYVLGISDKWIKQFESIALESPDWYDGAAVFSTAAFGSFMASTMSSAQSAMTSSPSSGGFSSSGSSGGGSSGGGSGGGGGGSW